MFIIIIIIIIIFIYTLWNIYWISYALDLIYHDPYLPVNIEHSKQSHENNPKTNCKKLRTIS
jgi:hypothetical protein